MSKYSFRKNQKNFIRIGFIVALLGAFFFVISALSSSYAAVGSSDYETTNYNVSINVKDDNSAYITENIILDISNPIHGIYRYIPLSQMITFYDKDGKEIETTRKKIKVEDVSVEKDPFEVSKNSGNRVIQIGDSNTTITGKHDYSLSYKVGLYDDGIKDYDEFYYNVIPSSWEDTIDKATITINMPDKFSKKDVNVLVGNGDTEYGKDYFSWEKEGNTITITTKKPLPANSYITVGIMLPEGYFSNELSDTKTYMILFGIGFAAAALMMYLWFSRGRDPKSVNTVEFYPPEDLSPAEVGYIIDGICESNDVLSLITYFAQKGYLSIKEVDKKSFELTKLIELPDTAPTYQKTFFRGIFHKGDVVKTSDLDDVFAASVSATVDQIEGQYEKKNNRVFSKKASTGRIFVTLITLIAMAANCVIVSNLYGGLWSVLIPCIFAVVGVFISYSMAVNVSDKRFVLKRFSKFTLTLFSLLFLVASMVITFLYMYLCLGTKIGGIIYCIMLFCGYFSMRYMQCRTAKGAELLGKILGFREFIQVSELDKLNMLVEENPSYFYDVLPYAYVLGLSKKWSKKFENIKVDSPTWYQGNYGTMTVFNTWIFYSSFHNCMHGFTSSVNNLNINPVGSNGKGSFGGGFGGGGGFSGGGGFGGGGGGAW